MREMIGAGLFYVFCAVAGGLTGFGICQMTGEQEIEYKTEQELVTEDNTPVPEQEEGVFFVAEEITPVVTPEPTFPPVTETAEEQRGKKEENLSAQKAEPVPAEMPVIAEAPVVTESPLQEEKTVVTEETMLPSLGMLLAGGETGFSAAETTEEGMVPETRQAPHETPVLQTVTIPAKIFGQTPVLNPSDTYVSYFEFCYDLISRMEPKVQEKGLNMNILLTKFALKALLCGVDVEKLDINAPIPRRQAALCLWLAAQVLNENGTDTSAKSAEKYVTDISGCSSSEKKAIAYLYEQGIVKGFLTEEQRFYPSDGLGTKDGSTWLDGVVRCWK